MRYVHGLFIVLALTLIFPAPAAAWRQGFLAGPHYRHMAQQALDQPEDFNFTAFRRHYFGTEQYDPLGSTVKEEMLTFAYAAQTETDRGKKTKALDGYAALVSEHLASLDVVNQALALSREDNSFGDPAFFEWLRGGLARSIISSGDGQNLFRAYDVITLGEETALLGMLNVEVLASDSRESGGVYYNMHEVRDEAHEGPYTVFVDLSLPMERLEQRKRDARAKIDIPKQ